MPLQLNNTTTFTCQELPMQEKNGANILRIVLKAGYLIDPQGTLRLAETQPEVVMEDEYWGEPGASSVRYESDVTLCKPHTDLIVNGHATAPLGKQVSQSDVTLYYNGRPLKHLRVFGDWFWTRGLTGWTMTPPQFFQRMPLVYERAYGGCDEAGGESRNLVGTGYSQQRDASFEGARVANIELPKNLIESPRDKPMPAGLGVVSKNWQPRLAFAGTYDKTWLNNRYPLLPEDFDMRFNQSAAPSQWIPRPAGGEEIALTGMTPEGPLRFQLPRLPLKVALHYRDHTEDRPMDLDTILIEPDERRLTLTWRASADIHGDPFRLLEMVVRAADAQGGGETNMLLSGASQLTNMHTNPAG